MNFKIKKAYYRFFSVFLSIVMIVLSVPIMSVDASAVDEDFSGIWLFNNVKYDKQFIHINDNNGTNQEGEIIELHNYNKYWALRWYIISVGNGYYKIESLISDKVLTAPTGYNNDIVTQTDYAGLNTQQWKFIEQSDGTYKISPRSNLNFFLAAGNESSVSDQNLEIRTAQSDKRDKWNLIDINYQYYVSAQHYYDFGYADRFSSLSTHIHDYQDVCSAILSELFNVRVNYSVRLFESSADKCTGSQYTTDDCTHNINHKTQAYLRNDITSKYGNGNATSTRIIWTGHKLDESQSTYLEGSETIVMTIGMVTDAQNNYSNHPSSAIFNQRVYTLLHETSHFLGLGDHRCYDQSSYDCNNPRECCYRCDMYRTSQPICLMSSYGMLDLKTRLDNGNLSGIYCYFCTSSSYEHSIVNHLSNHH